MATGSRSDIILIVGGMLSLFIGVRFTEGASVAPILVPEAANQTCQQLAEHLLAGSTWIELKVDPNPEGPGPFNYSDGTLTGHHHRCE